MSSNEPKCPICGDKRHLLRMAALFVLYCTKHETLYGHEYSWCGHEFCTVWSPEGANCAFHGGADYVPRTAECQYCNGTERIPCPNGCSDGDYCNVDGCDCDGPGNPGTIRCICNPNLTREEQQELAARLIKKGNNQ